MTADEFLRIISMALPLAAIAGAAFVYMRQSADQAQREVDQQTIASLEKRVEVVNGLMEDQERQHVNDRAEWGRKYAIDLKERDHKIELLSEELQGVKQQNTSLARQVHTLQGVITQAAEIAHLQETLDEHHGEAIEHWRALLESVESIKEAMA